MSDINATFIPAPGDMDPEDMVRAAIATIDEFTERFNARDLAGMDALLHFPHIILSGETLTVWDAPGQMPRSFFDDLVETTGWAESIYHERRPVLVSARKVHLLVRYSRNRADGSVITQHDNLWIVTHDKGRWGIKQRSYETPCS